ncbi:MAG: cyclic nucleotide-binding domain-containing protein [Gammaproteobacteria bacterium]|nr:MAG: cyclic nucleotide-binding domain-containing protein [Gammaproteobacteria bacterium]
MSNALHTILEHPEFTRGKCWEETTFEPGETILHEGDTSRDLYLIVSGVVRVNMTVDVSPEKHLESGLMEMTHGDTFGELNLFGIADRVATVVSMSTTKLIRMDGAALTAFMDRYPELGYPVLKDYLVKHADMLRIAKERIGSLYAERLSHE